MKKVFWNAKILGVPTLNALNNGADHRYKHASLKSEAAARREKDQGLGPKRLYEDVEGKLQSLNICSSKMSDGDTPLCISAQRSTTEISGRNGDIFLTHPQQSRSNSDYAREDVNAFQAYANNGNCDEHEGRKMIPQVMRTENCMQFPCGACSMNEFDSLWRKDQYQSSPENKNKDQGLCTGTENDIKYYAEKVSDEAQRCCNLELADSNRRKQIVEIYRMSNTLHSGNSVEGGNYNDYLTTSEHEIRDIQHEHNSDNICNPIKNVNINRKCENGDCIELKQTFMVNSIKNSWNAEDPDSDIDNGKSLYNNFHVQTIGTDVDMIKVTEAYHIMSRNTQISVSSPERQLQFASTPISMNDLHNDYTESNNEANTTNNQTLLKFEVAGQDTQHHNMTQAEPMEWGKKLVNCNSTQPWDYDLDRSYYATNNVNKLDSYKYENNPSKFTTNSNVQPFLLDNINQHSTNTIAAQEGEYNNKFYQFIPSIVSRPPEYSVNVCNSVAVAETGSYTTSPSRFDHPQDSFFAPLNSSDNCNQGMNDISINICLNMQQKLMEDLANAPKIPRRGRPPSKVGVQSKLSPVEPLSRSSAVSFSPVREKQHAMRRMSEPLYQCSSNFTIDPVNAKVFMAVQAAVPVGPPDLPSGFKCPFSGCEKVIKYRWGLKAHIWTHCGTRTHICTVCGTGFMRKNDLVRHIRRHTNEKPHICELCGKTFSRSDALKKHRYMDGHLHNSARTKL